MAKKQERTTNCKSLLVIGKGNIGNRIKINEPFFECFDYDNLIMMNMNWKTYLYC